MANLGFGGIQDQYSQPQTGGFAGVQGGGNSGTQDYWADGSTRYGFGGLNQTPTSGFAGVQNGPQAASTPSWYQSLQDEDAARQARVAAMQSGMNPQGGPVVANQQNGSGLGVNNTPSGASSGGFAGVQGGGTQPAQTGSASGASAGNPYLQAQADAITNQVNQNWTRNLDPSIRSGAMAAGGFGGSRQGVVEANALNDVNQGLSNSLANLYGSNYFNMGNLALNAQNQAYNQFADSRNFGANQYWTGQNFDAGRYDTTFNQNQQNFNNSLNLLNAQNGFNNQDITNSKNIQDSPMNYYNYFSNMANAAGGAGQSATTNNQGNPLLGAVGGYALGSSSALKGLLGA